MSILEQEIIEKFRQLDIEAQERVLTELSHERHKSFDYKQWRADVEALQASIRQRLGGKANIDALSLLDELREETS
jgi:hypothetical protein